MRVEIPFKFLLIAVTLVACRSVLGIHDLEPHENEDAAVLIDAPAPDAPPPAPKCAVPEPGAIGGACITDNDCESSPVGGNGDAGPNDGGVPEFQGLCQDPEEPGPIKWPPEGFCTRGCNENADCGMGNFCDATIKLCLPSCCSEVVEGQACSDGRLCTDNLASFLPLSEDSCLPGRADAADGDPCVNFYDCNIDSFCRISDLESPNGACHTASCTLGNNASCAPGGDGRCVAWPLFDAFQGMPMCIDSCDVDADCRESDGFRCFDDPVVGKFCRHPQVGEPCVLPTDCGSASLWDCRTGADFPNGYCTNASQRECTVGATSTSCSPTSTCFDPNGGTAGDQFCVAKCDQADPTRCRTGYSCRDAGDGAFGCIPNNLLPN